MTMSPKYLRMLDGMKTAQGDSAWSVYIVRCEDDSFYTGISKDVPARLAKHNSGRGAAYTRSRRPVRLLYSQDGLSRSQALVREAQIKSLPRKTKEQLVLSRPAKKVRVKA